MNLPFLQGQVAMVTGGSRGIGFETVRLLQEAGASVHFCGRSRDGVRQAESRLPNTLPGGGKVTGWPVDLTEQGQIAQWFEEVVEREGRLDVLVNNAGIGHFEAARSLPMEAWRKTIETNLTAAFFCSQQALARFDPARGGFIVNIASLASKNAFAGGAAYNASKFGLLGFSEAMMLDHRHDNVRVAVISPGSVATEFSPRRTPEEDDSWKIAAGDVAQMVVAILGMPARTLVSLVEMRPARPARK